MNLWCINQLNQLIIGAQHLVRILTSKVSRPGINEISERRPLHCCISTSTDERDERDERDPVTVRDITPITQLYSCKYDIGVHHASSICLCLYNSDWLIQLGYIGTKRQVMKTDCFKPSIQDFVGLSQSWDRVLQAFSKQRANLDRPGHSPAMGMDWIA